MENRTSSRPPSFITGSLTVLIPVPSTVFILIPNPRFRQRICLMSISPLLYTCCFFFIPIHFFIYLNVHTPRLHIPQCSTHPATNVKFHIIDQTPLGNVFFRVLSFFNSLQQALDKPSRFSRTASGSIPLILVAH